MAVLTDRRPAVYPSPADNLARFPGRADLVRESKMQSWVYLPLIASGRVIGTWTVSCAEQHATTPPELALLVALAALRAQSLERARRYEQAARTSSVLQRAIAPTALPALPGVLLAARYVPATAGDEVGGDLYDVRPLPGGREASAAPRAPQPLVDHVVEALRPVRRLDDLAVLALQRLPT